MHVTGSLKQLWRRRIRTTCFPFSARRERIICILAWRCAPRVVCCKAATKIKMDSLQEPYSCSRCERDCVRTQDYCIVCRVVIREVVGVQRNMDPASRYSGVAQFAGGVAAAKHDEPMQHCGYDHNGCIMSSSSEVVHRQECNMCGDVGFADRLQHCSACRSRIQHT